ncbi:hypothetical protein F53441_3917 [Fusarium austroafricanum]|uniref:Uncharacterized protein n=1 Tax=Fusarium austroafricanum TaxID=2364996 RepID=A0A8H4KLB2_9HYPO|nr:hypothetical protein F53441_3917 [Fusarium austroafricanum]
MADIKANHSRGRLILQSIVNHPTLILILGLLLTVVLASPLSRGYIDAHVHQAKEVLRPQSEVSIDAPEPPAHNEPLGDVQVTKPKSALKTGSAKENKFEGKRIQKVESDDPEPRTPDNPKDKPTQFFDVLSQIPRENPTGHTLPLNNPRMLPKLWSRDELVDKKGDDKDDDNDNEEEEEDEDDDENQQKEEKKEDIKKGKKKEKPYLWPEHDRPKMSKCGNFKYFYSSEGKQYAVATPEHLASETNRQNKEKEERDKKLAIIRDELQKEMDAKLKREEDRMKHVDEMKANASRNNHD